MRVTFLSNRLRFWLMASLTGSLMSYMVRGEGVDRILPASGISEAVHICDVAEACAFQQRYGVTRSILVNEA